MDVKIERKYDLFFMEPDGSTEIRLTKKDFPNRKMGFNRSDISVWFHFSDETLQCVVISSHAKDVKKKTLSQVEAEDEEEVKNFLKIRCLKDLRGLIMFMAPMEKKKVKKLKGSDITVKKQVWQWDYDNYCKRLVKNSIGEMTPEQARGLMVFLRGKKYE